ncbi:MAG: molecular chaperone TorD family protein [Deltaproteobacteria bacterium]|nr:molecular chaperone TorD family protein [Deltaproteobacteria bacterium]
MRQEAMVDREKLRADSYRLLSACYYRPQKALGEERVFENLSSACQMVCKEAVEWAWALSASFRQESEQDLLVDYAKLFVGPFELLAPPYGSVYLERKKGVMGDSTVAAQRIYEAMGLGMDKDFHELPDHITVELEFMYYLVHEEIRAYGQADRDGVRNILEQQEMFLKSHLGAWVFAFTERVQQGCETSFYRNLARCTSLFVREDMQYLAGQSEKIIESLGSCGRKRSLL